MVTCRICHYPTELDDIVLRHTSARCICLACYGRETGSGRRMSKALQQSLRDTLAALEPA